jgi:hypothetical protein
LGTQIEGLAEEATKAISTKEALERLRGKERRENEAKRAGFGDLEAE